MEEKEDGRGTMRGKEGKQGKRGGWTDKDREEEGAIVDNCVSGRATENSMSPLGDAQRMLSYQSY